MKKRDFVTTCPGPAPDHSTQRRTTFTRREILRTGLTGFASLSLGGLYNLRAQTERAATNPDTAVILVWLRGGASHLDTWDPKPAAPAEYRGPYRPIATDVVGIQISELLPRLSRMANRYALVRSLAHSGGGHPAGSLQMLSGDPDRRDKPKPIYPDWMSVAHYLRRDMRRPIPNYVAVNPVDRYDSFQIAGPAYLGLSYAPFRVTGDPSRPNFEIPNIGLTDQAQRRRFDERVALQNHFDSLSRDLDHSGAMRAMDDFQAQALNLLTSRQGRDAFDLSKEPARVRDRYGRNQWGQQCLMARRLVEAGVQIIATEFDGPLCGRVGNWDDHAVNHHVFEALAYRTPFFDRAVSALIEDIYQRGLEQKVMVIVTGEFGRTPRISNVASSGGGRASRPRGTKQPGRDHWPRAGSMLFAGGGIRTGQIVGATDRRGEDPIRRRVGPGDFLATIYHHLGIDYQHTTLPDFTGRPVPILNVGAPITELSRTR